MIIFLYFFLLWLTGFVLGATIFVSQLHSRTYLVVLTLWYGVALYGIHLYTGRLAMRAFSKWSGNIHEEESLVEKIQKLWRGGLKLGQREENKLPEWARVWGKKSGRGRYFKRRLSKARRKFAKQMIRFGRGKSPAGAETECNWKGH